MAHPNAADHAVHDALLIAGHAAGDLIDVERARAEALLAACPACSDLRRDLVAIAAATRSVPAPAALTRDLRLTAEQAERLRRGSWLRGFLRPFAAAGSPIRPMAAAFTSLGLVGLLVGVTLTSGPGAALFSAFSGSERSNGGPVPAAAEGEQQGGGNAYEPNRTPALPLAADASERAVAVEMSSGGAGRDNGVDRATIVPGPSSAAANSTQAAGGATGKSLDDGLAPTPVPVAPQPPSPLIAGSLALLGIGLLLFGLRIASRRVR
jgi:hypothetical protein